MKVKFLPDQIEYDIQPGQSVLQVAQENGIKIRSICNGAPSCAECRVRLVEGDANVMPPSRKELSLIGTGYFIDQRRLSCQLLCYGDVTVDISEQKEKENEVTAIPKKFQAAMKKAGNTESHAVGGILIEQDHELIEQVAKEARSSNGSAEADSVNRDQNRNSNRNRNRKRRRNRRRRPNKGSKKPE